MKKQNEHELMLKKLANLFNREFGPPFLKEGSVKASVEKDPSGRKFLTLSIGRRDVDLDADFNVLGSGTSCFDPIAEEQVALRAHDQPSLDKQAILEIDKAVNGYLARVRQKFEDMYPGAKGRR